MTDARSTEIPSSIREMAEANVAQSKAAFEQFLGLARKAHEMMTGAADPVELTAAQLKAKRFAELNMEANFRLAAELAEAHDVEEYGEIQARFAQVQALTLMQQTKTLGRMMAAAAGKAKG